jgi:hydroquinone glucosyltransferase
LSLAHGFLLNSFSKMEASTVRALQKMHNDSNQLVYLVEPIIQNGSKSIDESNGSVGLKWLENQTPNTVLYVSFGSAWTLSQQKINELALGLELSGQKFLWVLREPSNSINVGNQSATNDHDDPLKFLPQGLVVHFWAP